MNSSDSDKTSKMFLFVPHHHAVAHKVVELRLDLLLDGVGSYIFTPAGNDHIFYSSLKIIGRLIKK